MNAYQFQQQFSQAVYGQPAEPLLEAITGPADPAQLLQLYRNNYVISLTEYLAASFPVCQALVGKEFMAELAKAYIKVYPPKQPEVEAYGERLAAFIEGCSQAASVPYLADMARLEWLLDRLGNLRTDRISPFPFEELSSLQENEQSRLCFQLSEHIRWISSPYPLFSIWNGVQNAELTSIDLQQGESILLQTMADNSVRLHRLSVNEVGLLEALQKHLSVAEILQDETLSDSFNQHLQDWIQQGIISNFLLAEKGNKS